MLVLGRVIESQSKTFKICLALLLCPGKCCLSLFSMIHVIFSSFFKAAEKKNRDLEEKIRTLRTDVEERKQRQSNLKTELKNFLDILDGKIDELHDFRQGLSKLGVDN